MHICIQLHPIFANYLHSYNFWIMNKSDFTPGLHIYFEQHQPDRLSMYCTIRPTCQSDSAPGGGREDETSSRLRPDGASYISLL
jgi:hypothetical protein